MELELKINIDWIDEEMEIDDIVKREIINGIINKVNNQLSTKVEQRVEKKIDSLVVKKVNDMTDKMFKDFTKRKITITDGYGDKLKVYNTLRDFMKYKFDNFLLQTVDEKGNSYDGNYSTKHKRINYMIDKQLKEFADKFTSDTVKKVSAEIKRHVSEGLTHKLGSELMSILKVDKMLELNSKK